MSLQIFISYARNDDLAPLGSDDGKAGFVTVLDEHLRFHFRALGPPTPHIWRDRRAIEPSDQFDPMIEEAVGASDLLLVVLSNNWIHRQYCLHELELFAARWKGESQDTIKRRILVVAKNYVDRQKRPALLQGQEGYQFFRLDDPEDRDPLSCEQEFFGRGKLPDEYHAAVERLARDIWKRARTRPEGEQRLPTPEGDQPVAGARRIYLAQPAADMRLAHVRVADELRKRGYNVTPSADAKIPPDDRAAAQAFVDEQLAGVEASIHLLGEKPGYRPEDDGGEPIVPLQLRRASLTTQRPFRRIIWAPKILLGESDAPDSAVERDPLAVLTAFDRQVDDDKIYGGELSGFVEFLVQHLANAKPVQETVRAPIGADARVFVEHAEEDTEYALELAEALAERQIEPVMPVFGGSPVEVEAWRKERLQDCDAVVVCWAHSSEVWARSQTSEFRDWTKLGREREFSCRALVAGPPPDVRKGVMVRLPPRREIDVVLDLTSRERLTPDDIRPIVGNL